ncbi:MAG TPA: hypothetical protein DCS67_12830 [Clostridiales bacterium UBA8960]|nr:hypothetical protein [Clostridiales bacterium UBA8960]
MEKLKVNMKMTPAVAFKVGILVIVAIAILIGLKPPSIAMNNDGLKIGGLYGKLYEWDVIENVELFNQMPKIGMRTNGMDLGSTKRGYFNMGDYGSSTLYVNTSHEAFIVFKYGDRHIFVSFDDAQKGLDAYETIMMHTN